MSRGPFERAHGEVQRAIVMVEDAAARPDLDGCARAIERFLGRAYDLVDGRDAAEAARLDAEQALEQAARAAPDALGDLRKALGRARKAWREAVAETEAVEVGPIVASAGLPRLHGVARSSLTPSVAVAPDTSGIQVVFKPLDPPRDLEGLDDFGARQRAHIEAHLAQVFAAKEPPPDPPGPPRGAARFVTQWARMCFEEIAMLGSQRRPLRGDDWRTSADLEARMLHALDAFASLGASAVDELERLVLDAPAPDPQRAQALAFLCGSLAGRDALGMVERVARAQARDPRALDGIADGLRHAPHPALTPWLEGLLEDDEPALRALGARLLAARGHLGADRLEALTNDRPEIARHALLPMALSHHRGLESALVRALAAPQTHIRRAAWSALALWRPREAVARLRTEMGDEAHGDEAALLLAAIGTRADAEAVADRALRHPTPMSLRAAAVAGHVPSLPRLIDLLRHDDLEVTLAAAAALERVTGAGLFEVVELPPEAVAGLDLPEPSTGGFLDGPLGRATSDPRDPVAGGSADRVELPDPSHVRWIAFWREHQHRFEVDTRYRGGAPLAPRAVLGELSGPRLDHDDRRFAGVELLLRTGRDVGFDVDAFVVAQIAALDTWAADLGSGAVERTR